MFNQNSLQSADKKSKKRIGRGNASGSGTTAGRGANGQNSRSGGKRRPGFEGGQTPLIRKMPKRPGFIHPHAKKKAVQVINLADLTANFEKGGKVTKEDLKTKGLISSALKAVKILGQGEVSQKFELHIDLASKSAKEAIEKAGGSIELAA